MDDIKAIDIQCRPFCVRPLELLKPMSQTYEFKIMRETVFKGPVIKMGLKPGEEWKASQPKNNVAELIEEMDEAGVELCFMDQLKLWSWHEHRVVAYVTIEEMEQIVAESNGRIVPGCSYNPWRIKESLDEIEKAVKDHGFKYVWFQPLTYGLRPDDRRYYPLYAMCERLGLPVAFQTGHAAEPVPCEGGRPYYADIVAIDFPNLKIILTHTGWPWIEEWISMTWKHPNVYGCINGYMPKDLDSAIVKFMDSRGRDKVMWGTNGWFIARNKKEFMDLPMRYENKKKVLRENAIQVFNLPIKP